MLFGKPYLGATEGNEAAHQNMKVMFRRMCSKSSKTRCAAIQLLDLLVAKQAAVRANGQALPRQKRTMWKTGQTSKCAVSARRDRGVQCSDDTVEDCKDNVAGLLAATAKPHVRPQSSSLDPETVIKMKRRNGDEDIDMSEAAQFSSFTVVSVSCANVPEKLREQMSELEEDNMDGYTRNGDPFLDYFDETRLTAHIATDRTGALAGFAIRGGREAGGKLFLYELHVAEERQGEGLGRALLTAVENSTVGVDHVDLHVHKDNENRAFYEHMGYVGKGRAGKGGKSLLMRKCMDVCEEACE